MIGHKSTAADYLDAGAFNEALGIQCFVDEHIFLTKAGELGIAFRLSGIDFEGQDTTTLDNLARRFQSAQRSFSEKHRLYQYLVKTPSPHIEHGTYENEVVSQAMTSRVAHFRSRAESLFSIEVYLVIVAHVDLPHASASLASFKKNPKETILTLLSAKSATRVLASQLNAGRAELTNLADSFVIATADVFGTQVLDKHQTFRLFRRLLNFDPAKHLHTQLPSDDLLDYWSCDSHLEVFRDHLRLDNYFVSVLTLKQPPSSTWANTLADLIRIPGATIICSEFQRLNNGAVIKDIRNKQRHFHNTRSSFVSTAMAGQAPQQGEVLVNRANTAMVDELGECMEEIELRANYFGEFAFTLILYSTDQRALAVAVAEAHKAFQTKDALLTHETYNALHAYLATIPGGSNYQLRRLLITATNYADLSFLFTVSCGSPRNAHLNAEYLALFETEHSTPYYFNLHYKDVAHTLITGATGSGKSFLLNFLLTNAQKYRPYTVIFDLGGSYRPLTKLFGGKYAKLSLDQRAFEINPFSLPLTPENQEFIFSFVRVLLESAGAERLTLEQAREVFEATKNIYEIDDPSQRRLLTLAALLPKSLSARLSRWIEGGQYPIFDNATDTLTFAHFQAFDFEGLDKYPALLEPLLFYILHRANAAIYDPALATTFKLFVMDEAWRFFENDTIKSYLREALKTWRKRNAAMILATQSGDDLRKSNILDLILESCPTRIFLANPGLNIDSYRESFHLNATQAELIRTLVPKRQIFLHTPDLSKILTLNVDGRSYWLYTNSPHDNARRDALIEAHGLTQALNLLTAA